MVEVQAENEIKPTKTVIVDDPEGAEKLK